MICFSPAVKWCVCRFFGFSLNRRLLFSTSLPVIMWLYRGISHACAGFPYLVNREHLWSFSFRHCGEYGLPRGDGNSIVNPARHTMNCTWPAGSQQARYLMFLKTEATGRYYGQERALSYLPFAYHRFSTQFSPTQSPKLGHSSDRNWYGHKTVFLLLQTLKWSQT